MAHYIIFQLDGRIDDKDSKFDGDGREAYFQITRKVDEKWINKAFAQGFYQCTWEMEADNLDHVYAELNYNKRPTGQFCPSLSVGDLIYLVDEFDYQWYVVADIGFKKISIDVLRWDMVKVTDDSVIVECREPGCLFRLFVPFLWFDRFIKESLTNKYHRCTKCRIIDQHGIEAWKMISKEQESL